MAKASAWRTRPIFITSTFVDMQSERDALRNHVFPEIEERLRQRFHHLEPIDLRWGVDNISLDEEEERDLLALKVCLGEIERSRPFLIGLIGDRYGWVPEVERMQTAIDEAGFDTDVTGKSVTALEIEYGVLDSPEQQIRSRFYLRDRLPYGQMDPKIAALYCDEPGSPGAESLSKLKKRIKEPLKSQGRVKKYSAQWDSQNGRVAGLDGFVQMVIDDLWEDLNKETAEFDTGEPPTWQEAERYALVQFTAQRQRGHVPREAVTGELIKFVQSPPSLEPWGLCVTGEAGSGKSALFAHLYSLLYKKQEVGELRLLSHAAGISPDSVQVDMMLRRFVGELCGFLGQKDPLEENPSPQEIEEAFARLLYQASQETRVVVLIDALNQFNPTTQSRHISWLPRLWPENARLLATAIPGQESEALAKRQGAAIHELEPMNRDRAEDVAKSICSIYHRTLNADVLEVLLAKNREDGSPSFGNPLWLTMAVEELNLLDADDFDRAENEFTGGGGERLHQLMLSVADELPTGVKPLYAWLLERSEKLWGEAWARTFANLLACSRFGLRESDLEKLMPRLSGETWDPLRFAGLRRSFRAHLIQKGEHGQWDFVHAQARIAVKDRNLAHPEELRAIQSAIGDHLLELPPDDPLHIQETMHHLMEADDKQRAANYFGGDLSAAEKDGAAEILAQRILDGETEPENRALGWTIDLLRPPVLMTARIANICRNLNIILHDRLENTARLQTRFILLEAAKDRLESLAQYNSSNADWQYDLAVSHSKVGDILLTKGDLAGALKTYKDGLEIVERFSQSDPSNARWQHALEISFRNIGDIKGNQGDLPGALEAFKDSLEITERLAQADPQNVDSQWNLAADLGRVGDVLQEQGDLAGALEAFRDSLNIVKRHAQADLSNLGWQRNLLVSLKKVGTVLQLHGDLIGALKACEDSLNVAKRLAQTDPLNGAWQRDLAVSFNGVGLILKAQGDLPGALTSFKKSLEIRKHLANMDPINAIWQKDLWVSYGLVAEILEEEGDKNSTSWWQKAYDQLKAMQQAGLYISPQDQEFMSWFETKISQPSVDFYFSRHLQDEDEDYVVAMDEELKPADLGDQIIQDMYDRKENHFENKEWDEAGEAIWQLLNRGEPIAGLADDLSVCLINSESLNPKSRTRQCKNLLERLKEEGEFELAKEIKQEFIEYQVPGFKKSWWRK